MKNKPDRLKKLKKVFLLNFLLSPYESLFYYSP